MNPARWRLDGQTALITGASHGIGAACARELAGLGAHVLLVARNEADLDALATELGDEHHSSQIETLSADLADGEGRAALLDWLQDTGSDLHMLINNVGGNLPRLALEYSDQDLQFIYQTNVTSTFEVSRLCQPWLKLHGAASIVNVASVSGMTAVRTGVAYGMAKAAVLQMTRNLAVEWASDGIRVNAVAPWYIRTRRSETALADVDYLEQVLDRTPLGRIGEAEDVAAAVAFLCLPAAGYITGECIAVDGGFLRYGF